MIDIGLHKTLKSAKGPMHLELNMSVEKGKLVTLYGPSGVGKTSVLRMIAGLMIPDSGRIVIGNQIWFDNKKGINIPVRKRRLGFLFQQTALFPNMTIEENLTFALDKGADRSIVNELIDLFHLGKLKNEKPDILSGGQIQRAGLARALARQPELLLLDEPFSSLDQKMKTELQDYVIEVNQKYETTILMVSHDVYQMIRMSDHILQMDNGKIVQEGSPDKIFTPDKVSGKFKFIGRIIDIQQQDFMYIISVMIGNDVARIIADESEASNLKKGDQVMVASKAFNPIIRKLL